MSVAAKPPRGRIEDAGQVVAAYDRWAPVYDLAFAAVMRRGRQAAAAAVSRSGTRVLDVGVGTGLELPMFGAGTTLVGIDLAEAMLRRAAERVRRHALVGVEGLCVMDATRLAFADASFDAAVVPYVLTVVPEPEAMLDEVCRVVRPGGAIVLVNHFGTEGGPVASVEGWLGRRSASLGWHPQFPFAVLGDWLAANGGSVDLVERRKLPPFGLFTLVRLAKAL
ncbi:MAG TPA: class I SAM-dependent methyltransferase [Lichenihabitans sp.]|nr:class I SAM-dependent methyltransferase [Lichenihabitans sp.]